MEMSDELENRGKKRKEEAVINHHLLLTHHTTFVSFLSHPAHMLHMYL